MDIPAGNILPDPYSDNAATSGQLSYPWRGRIPEFLKYHLAHTIFDPLPFMYRIEGIFAASTSAF